MLVLGPWDLELAYNASSAPPLPPGPTGSDSEYKATVAGAEAEAVRGDQTFPASSEPALTATPRAPPAGPPGGAQLGLPHEVAGQLLPQLDAAPQRRLAEGTVEQDLVRLADSEIVAEEAQMLLRMFLPRDLHAWRPPTEATGPPGGRKHLPHCPLPAVPASPGKEATVDPEVNASLLRPALRFTSPRTSARLTHMENSDSGDDGDESAAQRRSQKNRLARDFYRFVNNLSEDEYKLMKGNNLLGNPGESTEEELRRRLHLVKENLLGNSGENTGILCEGNRMGWIRNFITVNVNQRLYRVAQISLVLSEGNSADDVSSSDSLIDWLISFEPTENQTKNVICGQGEHQPWREVSQANPHRDFRFSSGSPSAENKYAPSTRLPRRENVENSHSHMENAPSESRFTRPSKSEQGTPGPSIKVPPTRGQKRARSRSPDHSRTRARTESRSPPRSLGELLQRFHHSASSPTFEQPFVSETERAFRSGHQETSRQRTAALELQHRHLFATSGTRNAVQGESSPDTTGDGESYGLRQIYPTICLCCAVGQVHPVAYSERDSITSRTQITSEIPNNSVTLESEQGELRHMFSYYEQADMRAYVSTIGIPICRILSTGISDTISGAIQSTLRQTVTYFSDSSNLMDSESDLEPRQSAPSQYMERAESPNGRDSSHGRSFSSNSNSSCDSCLHSTLTSSSNSSYTSSSSFSLMSNSSPV
ncbi:hypothetical protein QTO34_007671 [Cnephaeus nilssonii]|uniref:E3 ubiquitin-protein ligase RNF6/12 N-terminal domain-containing protein n=1 Tax=Cnephaeus nilssonii TaxID=3371016 RepID=A0AA40LHM1_CNENI|nr:hypothetical protein QTO34_007671 [Eptesicus nilssonii]